jgi:hypothetical protein
MISKRSKASAPRSKPCSTPLASTP